MKKYEFKITSVPLKARKFTDLSNGKDAYNETVAVLMNELGSEGWEFTGVEMLPRPKRRFRKQPPEQSVLVFPS